MQKYPYYTINRLEGGILQRILKSYKFNTQAEATVALNKWRSEHSNSTNQYVILHYTSSYTSRICMIFEKDTIIWVD